MDGARFIRTVRLEGVLSYASGGGELSLEPLNVLIGPNASGKSNLIEALSLLAAAPGDLQVPIREGGGVHEWIWKGTTEAPAATVEVTTEYPNGPTALRYRLSFGETGTRFDLRDEVVENEIPTNPHDTQPYFYYRYQEGQPVLNVRGDTEAKPEAFKRRLMREDVKPDQSILSQRRDPDSYPELTYLANQFERMRFYREFSVGHHAPPRLPQNTDLQQDRLLEDASNLGLVLSGLLNQPPVKQRILDKLREFYPSIRDIVISVSGGTVQIFFHEAELRHPVPAVRLSDGSLRYLCLLAVLCNPDPPPVVCIEEPEIGLHPDVIPEVADLMVEASARSQLLVTTHSDILVDALTNVPEAVVVCEKLDGATRLRRLDAEEIGPWIEKYRLGEIWTQGEIGGNRW